MHCQFSQPDQQLRWFSESELSDWGFDSPARLVVTDLVSGAAQAKNCSEEQFAAIIFLAIVGDEHPQSAAMYEIAAPIADLFDKEFRPIP